MPLFVVNITGVGDMPYRITGHGLLILLFIILSHYWCSTSRDITKKTCQANVSHISYPSCAAWFHRCSSLVQLFGRYLETLLQTSPRAKFMGPTQGPSGADRTQVGLMLAPWTLLSGIDEPNQHQDKGRSRCFVSHVRLQTDILPIPDITTRVIKHQKI